MKHIKTLLGLVLMVFVLAGCSNPAGPEIPEDIDIWTEVEFKWTSYQSENRFETQSPIYLLDLHRNSDVNNNYAYYYPEGYWVGPYSEFCKKEEFKKFSDDAFKEILGIKYYKEGEEIPLEKWTHRAIDLAMYKATKGKYIYTDRLYFLMEDIKNLEEFDEKKEKSFDKVSVGNEKIVIYVYFESKKINSLEEIN